MIRPVLLIASWVISVCSAALLPSSRADSRRSDKDRGTDAQRTFAAFIHWKAPANRFEVRWRKQERHCNAFPKNLNSMGDKIEELRRDAKHGPLNRYPVQMLKLFAKQGFPK